MYFVTVVFILIRWASFSLCGNLGKIQRLGEKGDSLKINFNLANREDKNHKGFFLIFGYKTPIGEVPSSNKLSQYVYVHCKTIMLLKIITLLISLLLDVDLSHLLFSKLSFPFSINKIHLYSCFSFIELLKNRVPLCSPHWSWTCNPPASAAKV